NASSVTPAANTNAKPTEVAAPGATAEPTTDSQLKTKNAGHLEHADDERAGNGKESSGVFPPDGTVDQRGGTAKPVVENEKQPSAATAPANDMEGDPFRDDPLPAGR